MREEMRNVFGREECLTFRLLSHTVIFIARFPSLNPSKEQRK